MKKLLSLIKATMSSDMSLFKVRSKKGSKNSPIVPLFIAACFMGYMALISNSMLKSLEGTGMEYVFLSLIVILTCFLTIMEGVYKSGNLLFNCKDDDLLLSLPISKKTVLFIRVFKFYTFELMYNSLYLLPAIVVYTFYVKVSLSYYLVSFLMLFLLPIIPIVISCIIGSVITGISSRFKFKNAFQIIITMALLLGVFYVSMNIDSFLEALAKNAKSINDFITMIYYPAGVYVNLVLKFDALELLKFIVVNLGLFIFSILMLSKLYFSINSRTKRVIKKEVKESNKELVIKANSKTKSLVKKELGKFFKTPVFITNAGFGLLLFVIICIGAALKQDTIANFAISSLPGVLTAEDAVKAMPVLSLGIVMFGTLTTSITSSLISLEGRNINILKALPVHPKTIIMSKVYASLVIMIPPILIGTLILIIKFRIGIIEALILIVSAIILCFISGIFGILVNLYYPKLDAENDTEIVKQSKGSMVAVFTEFMALGALLFFLIFLLGSDIPYVAVLLIYLALFAIVLLILYLFLKKKGVEKFNKLTV